MKRAGVFLVFFLVFSARAVQLIQEQDFIRARSGFYQFEYRLSDGSWSLYDADGELILKSARARALARSGSKLRGEVEWLNRAGGKRNWQSRDFQDALGKGIELAVSSCFDFQPCFTERFRFYDSQRFFTLKLCLSRFSEKERRLKIKFLEPFFTSGSGSGLKINLPDQKIAILDNGSLLYLDFLPSVFSPALPPLPSRLFNSKEVANWNQLIYLKPLGKSYLAGFLRSDWGAGQILCDFSEEARLPSSTRFWGYSARTISRPPLAPSARDKICSELVYLDFFAPSPFQALEDYARAVARVNKKPVWQKPIPSGWNSWGEYFCDINEDIVLRNLEFAQKNFQPFGMNYFQIDCGYSRFWGDWEPDPGRFPHGMKWLAEQIKSRGMIPGIWLAPLCADARSRTFKEHPDWFLPKKGLLPRLLITGEGQDLRVLDISQPGAEEFLRKTIRKYTQNWGYKWLKVDFAYYLLYYHNLPGARETVPYYYRKAMRIIKEEAGEDVFVVGIGVVGFNYGLVDAQRISLDNMPAWSNNKNLLNLNPFSGQLGFAQGLVPTARVIARRYWLNHNLWINHPDLIFFDNLRWKDWSDQPLGFDQSLAFASLVGLTGGIVKIGDKMVEMSPEQVAVIQKLLPIYPKSARPMDLFEKKTPEIWLEEIKTDFDSWWILGLFNWGDNWTIEGKHLASQKRVYQLDFSRLGLDPNQEYLAFDFWQEKFLGKFKSRFKIAVEPERVKVIKLVPARSYPWFLSYNRHITQGAVDIKTLCWEEKTRTLSGSLEAVPGFEYRLYFSCPEKFQLRKALVNGKEVLPKRRGEVVCLKFKNKQEKISFRLKFSSF